MVLHGDDIFNYRDIRLNFSSNVYNGFDHKGLFAYLADRMACVMNYPEPEPHELEAMIAHHLGVEPEEVMVTNGAVEAIYLIAQTYRDACSYICQPTFGEYAEACRINGHEFVPDLAADLVWMCNPNNPTGMVVPKQELEDLIIASPLTTFVLDQSYQLFSAEPQLSAREIVQFDNVFSLHSMTKEYAIPGLRLGYVIAHAKLLDKVRRQRMPWSVNALAIEAGKYLLCHADDYGMDIATLLSERKRVADALNALGIETCPSDTHILLCRLPSLTAAELKDRLARGYGILIRDASNFDGLTPQHFRIAVQSSSQNDALLASINNITNSKKE